MKYPRNENKNWLKIFINIFNTHAWIWLENKICCIKLIDKYYLIYELIKTKTNTNEKSIIGIKYCKQLFERMWLKMTLNVFYISLWVLKIWCKKITLNFGMVEKSKFFVGVCLR